MKKTKAIALGVIFFLLFFGWFSRARALPWGSILYHTSESGKMYGYNNFEFSPISSKFYPGAVGIYIGKSKKFGWPLVVEVDYGQVRIIPAQYFVDLDRGEEFVGAKIPKDFNYSLKAAKSIMRKIIAQEGELFDHTYAQQKGPQSGDWTSVGFVEKIYESTSAPHLTYHPDPLMNYSHYDINITPDGFDKQSKINDSGDCFSLSQEFSALHQFGQGDFWSQFAFKELKDIIKKLKTKIDLSQFLSLSIWGKNYGGDSYFFFPATQFNQKTLRDVDLDIKIASFGKSQIEGTRSQGLRQLDAVGAFTDRFIREAGALVFRNVVAGKDSFLGSAINFVSSVKNWLSLGKKITDLAEAGHIKIDLNFMQNLNAQKGIDAALGLWGKSKEFVEFASQESSEIADLVRKGLLSGPRAEAKFEDLIADIDIAETLVTKGDSLVNKSPTSSQKEQALPLDEEPINESLKEEVDELNKKQEGGTENQESEEGEGEQQDEQESEEQFPEQDEELEEPPLLQYSPSEV
ncbi:hypothetical protein K9K85_01380, partial [Patescibacteria group bacterium]|nr:hypothetical protein [Patescibacteria group bacterium]